MAVDDDHVLVVVVRRAIAQVVRAGDHHAVVTERIDDDDLVVNDREADLVQLGFECAEDVGLVDRACGHRAVVRLQPGLRRFLVRPPRFADDRDVRSLRRLPCSLAFQRRAEVRGANGVGQRAAHEQLRVFPEGGARRVENGIVPRIERQEENGVPGAADKVEEPRHVVRLLFGRTRERLLGVG